ncbi:DinI-like family protein [Providencia stuartii]
MVNIKIRLELNMKGKLPIGTFQALQAQVEKRLKNKYPELNVDIGWGAHTSLNIDGLKKNEKKTTSKKCCKRFGKMIAGSPKENKRKI